MQVGRSTERLSSLFVLDVIYVMACYLLVLVSFIGLQIFG